MEYKVQPWGHQKIAIERARDLNAFGLFFEMGAGKTGTAINILREKFNTHKRVLRTIIFCPPIVCKNWKDEWSKHSALDPRAVIVLSGSGRDRLKLFTESQGKVFITNYESLQMDPLFQAFMAWKPEALVFDESHKLKSHNARRSRLASQLANPPGCQPYKYILSGSPVLNSPMDVFQQYKILDGGETFGENFFGFRHRYFEDVNAKWKSKQNYFPKWEIRPGAADAINKLLFRKAMSVKKIDCLDLPPLVQTTIKVGMTKEQARVYKELATEYIAFVEKSAVSATLAIVKALRLMQIASGFVSLDDASGEEAEPVKYEFKENPKIDALRELLEELTPHSKVIIWAVWKQNYAQIGNLLKELELDYVEVHGGISDAKKREAVERFNNDPTVRVFVGHPGSGGIGINLKAPYSIFYSRNFSLEHSLQAEARNHRGDSKAWGFEKITRYDLVCEDTIDAEVVERLTSKLEISNALLKTLVKNFSAK